MNSPLASLGPHLTQISEVELEGSQGVLDVLEERGLADRVMGVLGEVTDLRVVLRLQRLARFRDDALRTPYVGALPLLPRGLPLGLPEAPLRERGASRFAHP